MAYSGSLQEIEDTLSTFFRVFCVSIRNALPIEQQPYFNISLSSSSCAQFVETHDPLDQRSMLSIDLLSDIVLSDTPLAL